MSVWLVALVSFVPPLAVPVIVAMRADPSQRLVAVQFGGVLTAFALAFMTFAFDQPSFIDLALCLVLLSVPGTLLFSIFMERWL